MQNHHPDLGELTSLHRPSTARLWILSVIALALLVPVILGALFTLDFVAHVFGESKADSFEKVSKPLICLGGSSLLLLLMGSILISDFRKWFATRTVKLAIYQKGFTYDGNGRVEACHWDEIKDITHRSVEVRSKHSPPKRVRLIRSIVKQNGEMISLAETLDLMKITKLINAARSEYQSNQQPILKRCV